MRHERHHQRAAQDHMLAERHAGFDRAARDKTMKYERFSFAVIGEGSTSALSAYRRNYDSIDWRA
jgi:hypothetical protein